MSKICPTCRKINPSGALACDGCGADLSRVADRAQAGGVSMFGAAPSAAGRNSVYGASTEGPDADRSSLRARLASDLARARSGGRDVSRGATALRIDDCASWPGPAQPVRPWAVGA